MTEAVFVQPRNVSGAPLTQALSEVSFDAGQTFRALTATESASGLTVQVQQKFTIRVSQPHYTPVIQPLIVNAPQQPGSGTTLAFDGAADFAAGPLTSTQKNAGQDINPLNQHFFTPFITLFRDGTPARTSAGQTPLPNFPLSNLAWGGTQLLSTGGTGVSRFAAQVSPNVAPVGAGTGKLVFGLTVDATVPQLAAIYVPDSVDLSGPIPIHIFFAPSTGGKTRPYPFSNGPKSFNEFLDTYLINIGKRLLSQHVAAKVRCVFVLPVPPPSGYLGGIQDAPRLRQYCLEVAFFVRKFVGNQRFPDATLGRCALSGFSEGGRPLKQVVSTSHGDFPELKEVYGLDIVPPSGSSADGGSYRQLLDTLTTWHAADSDRHVRLYTHYPAFSSAGQSAIKPAPVRSNGGATESQGRNATFAFLPIAFWQTVASEAGPNRNPNYDMGNSKSQPDDRQTHQLIPAVMLEHALANSGFAKG
ncbi:MAG TPA: hypothetical protein VJV79_06935 [Polyangiaceae bacterium]|nr:hypothetical protein [Polyangiaceae bacterium]